MIYMDVDSALSEVPVNAAPLTDDGDFKSTEESIAHDAAGMDLEWHFTTTGGATTVTAVTPTTGGDYDWVHQGNAMYTIEMPASGGASANNDTEGYGRFVGKITGVLPFVGPWICFRAAALNNADIDGGDVRDVNVTEVAAGAITAAAIATGAFDADSLATDAVEEIRNAITGGAYALNTSASGSIRVVDGTSTDEISLTSGLIDGITGTLNTFDDLAAETLDVNLTEWLGVTPNVLVSQNVPANVRAKLSTVDLSATEQTTVTTLVGAALTAALYTLTGTAQAGGSSSITLASGASATNDLYVGSGICLSAGSGAGQKNVITAYNGTTKVATVARTWATNPAFGTEYQLTKNGHAITWPQDKAGYGLADDAITASKFDESTAFPLASADTGSTSVARTGADSDTLETLSDQIDLQATAAALSSVASEVTSILGDTSTDGVVVADLTSAALTELRSYLHGADVAAQLDGSGYHKLSDGTGTGQIGLTSGNIDGIAGTIQTLDALDTAQDTQHSTSQTTLATLLQHALADSYIDTSGTPWTFRKVVAGTGINGTELGEWELQDVAAGDITDINTVIGRLVTAA